uniref:Retrotransposon gag domain-containing protein n=1 Tax=Myripristis murdjan TaxID=586833 RepID=A0A667YDD0_9TELE
MLRPNDFQCKLNTSDHHYATKLKSASSKRLEDNFTETQANPPKQSYGSKELSKVLSTLVHILLAQVKLSKSEVAELKQEAQQNTALYQQEVKRLTEESQALTTLSQRKMEEVLQRESYLKAQLEDSKLIQEGKNKQILEDSRCRIKALEGHLDDTKRQTRDLEQALREQELPGNILDAARSEEEEKDLVDRRYRSLPPSSKPRLPKRPDNDYSYSPSAAPRLVRQPGAALKDLDKVARNINTFTPSPLGGHDVHAYLQDVEYHAGRLPQATDEDRLHLIRITSSLEVRSFLDRQATSVKTDYTQLKQAMIREFADPESEQGLTTALDIKQGRQETPQAYYQRLRRAYFGSRNEADMEEDANFKTLFLRNLHPTVNHFLGVMACPRTMTSLQLRDLALKAFNKQRQRAASKKLSKTATVPSLDGDAPQRLPAAHPNEDSQFMPWSKSRDDQRKEQVSTNRSVGWPRKESTWRPSRGDRPARLSPPNSPRSSRSSRKPTYRRESRSGSPPIRMTREELRRIIKEVSKELRSPSPKPKNPSL